MFYDKVRNELPISAAHMQNMKYFLSRYCQTHISDVLFNIKKKKQLCFVHCVSPGSKQSQAYKREVVQIPLNKSIFTSLDFFVFLLTDQYVSISQTACQVQHFIIAFSNLLGYISNGMLSLDVIDTLNKCSGYNHVRGSCKQIPA